LQISGTLSPDVTGNYSVVGNYGGKFLYKLSTADWFIWWQDPFNWILSNSVGATGAAWWVGDGVPVTGLMTPFGTATGVATVTD